MCSSTSSNFPYPVGSIHVIYLMTLSDTVDDSLEKKTDVKGRIIPYIYNKNVAYG